MKVLYIEDPDDIEVFKEALHVVNSAIECDIARSCEEALNKLQSQKLPSLIFLDINMHPIDGKKCLEIIKQNPILKSIPVIIYSTSKSTEDLTNA